MSKLTQNQQRALRCLTEAGRFLVPPENQGQIVEVSYSCSPDYIYKRTMDWSDRTVEITAHAHPIGDADFEPWNVAPCTGRRVGVIYSGPAAAAPGLA